MTKSAVRFGISSTALWSVVPIISLILFWQPGVDRGGSIIDHRCFLVHTRLWKPAVKFDSTRIPLPFVAGPVALIIAWTTHSRIADWKIFLLAFFSVLAVLILMSWIARSKRQHLVKMQAISADMSKQEVTFKRLPCPECGSGLVVKVSVSGAHDSVEVHHAGKIDLGKTSR